MKVILQMDTVRVKKLLSHESKIGRSRRKEPADF